MKIYILSLLLSLILPKLNARTIENTSWKAITESSADKPQMEVKLNMTTKILEVKLPDLDGGGSVSIFNGDGQLVLSVFPEKILLNIDVSKLKKGSYLVVYGESHDIFQIK